jgi:hypothetical protein
VFAYLSSMPRAGVILSASSLSPSLSLPPPCFSALSHKRHDFRKQVTEHKMCVLIFYTHFISNISHSKNNSAKYGHERENVFM